MVAEKDKVQKKIFYAVGDNGASGWYRCFIPAAELKKRGHIVAFKEFAQFPELASNEIIIFQRHSNEMVLKIIEGLKEQGKLTVYELDDDIWNVHKSNPGYEFWNSKQNLRTAEKCISACDVVTTSTGYLGASLNQFSKNVYVLPNMLASSLWEAKRQREADNNSVVIGWIGGSAHRDNMKTILPALMQLVDEYQNLNLIVTDTVKTIFPEHERVNFVGRIPFENYPQFAVNFDIGISPLIDNSFNRCKSDLKFLEFSMLSIPSVLSKVEPYSNSVTHGKNGFLARNDKDWMKYLKRLIEDEELRKQIGKKAKEFAQSRTIEKNIHLWEEAYGIK